MWFLFEINLVFTLMSSLSVRSQSYCGEWTARKTCLQLKWPLQRLPLEENTWGKYLKKILEENTWEKHWKKHGGKDARSSNSGSNIWQSWTEDLLTICWAERSDLITRWRDHQMIFDQIWSKAPWSKYYLLNDLVRCQRVHIWNMIFLNNLGIKMVMQESKNPKYNIKCLWLNIAWFCYIPTVVNC